VNPLSALNTIDLVKVGLYPEMIVNKFEITILIDIVEFVEIERPEFAEIEPDPDKGPSILKEEEETKFPFNIRVFLF
jgi:hypothetical protein